VKKEPTTAMPRPPRDIPDAVLRIALCRGIGAKTFVRLMESLGSIDEIVGAGPSVLATAEGIGTKRADSIRRALDDADVDGEREAMESIGASLIVSGDADYPDLLAMIPDPPVALWVRGRLSDDDRLALAMVGARRCTAYGRDQAGRLAALLAQSGLAIVSGGARGIDGEAHRGALRVGGRTIAVLGCGLARAYPPEHAELFDHIVEQDAGAVLSEYPMHVGPRAEHFPRRNRIISGLSLGVLVVEAGRGSGALITARTAAEEHGREVMALPGRVDSPASVGCLQAIRDGWAGLVLTHSDVLLQLEESSGHLVRGAMEATHARTAGRTTATTAETSALGAESVDGAASSGEDSSGEESASPLFETNLTDDQRTIVATLREAGDRPISLDELMVATQLPMNTIMAELTILQIRNLVARNDRGVRIRRR